MTLLGNRAGRVRCTRVVCHTNQRVLDAARVGEVQLLFGEPLDLLDRVNPIDTDSYDWFDRLTPQ